MQIFFIILLKLIPLYIIIFLGYIGGKFLHIRKEIVATLLIDLVVPVVLFTGVVNTPLSLSTLSLPILFFCICTFISVLTFYISGFIWKDSTKNILAFIAGSANTGYFGLPVAVALFGNKAIGIVALIIFGTALYTNTLGYFIAAKGAHTIKESLLKVVKLPLLYALFLGILVNIAGIHLGKIFSDAASNFNGTYTVLGMMLIGIGLADIMHEKKFDLPFVSLSLLSKFLVWPLVMLMILFIDSKTTKLYTNGLHNILIVMSVLPLAVNTVPYATKLNLHPEKVSLSVLMSTLFALLIIPLVDMFFLK